LYFHDFQSVLRAVDQVNASSNVIPTASIEEDEEDEDISSSQPIALLRQSIAFNNDLGLSSAVPTYKYTPPTDVSSASFPGFDGSHFGDISQGMLVSQPQNGSSKTGKRKSKPRTKKYTDGFKDQTVVFRVDAAPDPSLIPSNFERIMSFSSPLLQNSRNVPIPPAPVTPVTTVSHQPEQYLNSGSGPYNSLYRIEKPKTSSRGRTSASSLPLAAPNSSNQASTSTSSALAGASSSASGVIDEDWELEDGSRILLPPENPPSMKSHYRHNYDKPEAQQLSSSRRKASVPEPLPPPSASHNSKFQPRPHRTGRMLTLLIKDVRNEGEVDEQLAEIRVPLRPAGTQAEDGYWADATQVVEALQEGVSAIEGETKHSFLPLSPI
jgi:hypothetical protein